MASTSVLDSLAYSATLAEQDTSSISIAVIVGASVGGFMGLLVLLVVTCIIVAWWKGEKKRFGRPPIRLPKHISLPRRPRMPSNTDLYNSCCMVCLRAGMDSMRGTAFSTQAVSPFETPVVVRQMALKDLQQLPDVVTARQLQITLPNSVVAVLISEATDQNSEFMTTRGSLMRSSIVQDASNTLHVGHLLNNSSGGNETANDSVLLGQNMSPVSYSSEMTAYPSSTVGSLSSSLVSTQRSLPKPMHGSDNADSASNLDRSALQGELQPSPTPPHRKSSVASGTRKLPRRTVRRPSSRAASMEGHIPPQSETRVHAWAGQRSRSTATRQSPLMASSALRSFPDDGDSSGRSDASPQPSPQRVITVPALQSDNASADTSRRSTPTPGVRRAMLEQESAPPVGMGNSQPSPPTARVAAPASSSPPQARHNDKKLKHAGNFLPALRELSTECQSHQEAESGEMHQPAVGNSPTAGERPTLPGKTRRGMSLDQHSHLSRRPDPGSSDVVTSSPAPMTSPATAAISLPSSSSSAAAAAASTRSAIGRTRKQSPDPIGTAKDDFANHMTPSSLERTGPSHPAKLQPLTPQDQHRRQRGNKKGRQRKIGMATDQNLDTMQTLSPITAQQASTPTNGAAAASRQTVPAAFTSPMPIAYSTPQQPP
ncbi:mucin-5B-like [Sycon ciliatum]|uniref:mucin-5B-like n=1 Tax=Sycon ciliatum TaxID=27933 RepID=UPI0031F69605|eukprot:scpid62061/ scgid9596/ 